MKQRFSMTKGIQKMRVTITDLDHDSWAIEQGASVRLIGDDQQLAAIGAGGVLRDIDATHGSVRLSELMRFSDPA
ncbi:MAG: AAA family ATPase, partial [Propionibacterium sp.]|nr:AAA family ATPase [Propionibacterium sp.]